MPSSHLFRLSQIQPQIKLEHGFRTKATKSNFPLLKKMSFYKLVLYQNAIREPHWHANADELGYCLKGKVLVSLFANKNTKATFLVTPGEVFYIPSGTLHDIENVGNETSELIFQFSHQEPEDFGLSSAFGMFSNSVLGNTWNVSGELFQPIKRSLHDIFISKREGPVHIPDEAFYASPYKYNLNNAFPLIGNAGGNAKVARKDVWPILERQALYSLELTGSGMREPHWHPDTAELGYIHKGKGRMSVLSPTGNMETYEINEGDIYFIPAAYPHHIENLTHDSLNLLIFFDRPMPGDIGFTASVKSYAPEVLKSVLNTPPELISSLPNYYNDLLIVNKINPLDSTE